MNQSIITKCKIKHKKFTDEVWVTFEDKSRKMITEYSNTNLYFNDKDFIVGLNEKDALALLKAKLRLIEHQSKEEF